MFMLALSALWFGASAAVRELIADRTIWRREARVGLSVFTYLASKVTVLGLLVTVQCTSLALLTYFLLDMGGIAPQQALSDEIVPWEMSLPTLLGMTTLTGWVGMSMGLLISSYFSSSEAAVGTLPLLLIPQIAFGGLLVPVRQMGDLAVSFSYLIFTRYSFEGMMQAGKWMNETTAKGGVNGRATILADGVRRNLGFKENYEDPGLPIEVVGSVLAAAFVLMLIGALFFTNRSREGN
jgi:hypothetical protein